MLEQLLDSALIPHLAALLAAYVLALPIGWDRETGTRSAGIRTFPLVAIASCGFIQAAESIVMGHAEATARIVEGVITGMGFIGGGAILKQGAAVKGTATAASLWATGAIGVSVALGSYDVAIVISLLTFITLKAMKPLKRHTRPVDVADDMDKDQRPRAQKTQLRRTRYRRA